MAAVATAAAIATYPAAPAIAVGNGIDPLVTTVVEPLSGARVDEWKLAGRASASGVQVAPQWIITSGHAPAQLGGVFTNQYGTSTVDSVVTCGGFQSGCDVSVAHLTTALPAPSFPDLLADGFPASTQPLGGNVLAAGYGGGRFAVGWTRPTGQVGYDTMFAPPSSIGGDSGGPTFYFRPGSAKGALLGLMVSADSGVTGGLQMLSSARVRPFLDNNLPAGTVTWTTFDGLGARPLLPTAVGNPTATATATSVRLAWSAPAAGSSPIVDYRAVLIRQNDPTDRRTVITSALTATFDQVPANVGYWAFVLPRSAMGEATVPWISRIGTTTPTYTFATVVAAGPAPGPVTNLRTTTRKGYLDVSWTRAAGAVAGVNQTEIIVRGCTPTAGCQPLGAPILTSGNSTSVAVPTFLATYGQRFLLTARDTNLTGSSSLSAAIGVYLPLIRPLPALDVRVEQRADGQLAFSYHDRADDPALATQQLRIYRPHAKPTRYEISVVDPVTGTQTLVTSMFPISPQPRLIPWTNLGLAAGRYEFRFTAIHPEWGSSTVSVMATIGGAPETANTVRYPAPPKTPTNLVGTADVLDGGAGTLSWTQPTRATGEAAPNAFIVVIRRTDLPSALPAIYETSSSTPSIRYSLPAGTYTIALYAVNQIAGSSPAATG